MRTPRHSREHSHWREARARIAVVLLHISKSSHHERARLIRQGRRTGNPDCSKEGEKIKKLPERRSRVLFDMSSESHVATVDSHRKCSACCRDGAAPCFKSVLPELSSSSPSRHFAQQRRKLGDLRSLLCAESSSGTSCGERRQSVVRPGGQRQHTREIAVLSERCNRRQRNSSERQ